MIMTTSLPVVENKIMQLRKETDTIRIPSRLMNYVGVEIGDKLLLDDGRILLVGKAFLQDEKKATAFVSKVDPALIINEATKITPLAPDTMTIGCDPEFILLDKRTGEVVHADAIFSGKGPLGCDAGLAEIRPAPQLSPVDVVENIRELLSTAKQQTNLLPIACSSYKGWMVGFHIHFGFPKALLLQAAEHSREFIENTILVLDYLVGIPAMLRDTSDSRRALPGEYGKPGDYKISENTLEYRVPGGFHLRCPRYALELMTAAYIVVEDVIGRGQLLNKYWSDTSSFFSREDFSNVYNIPNKKTIIKILTSKNKELAKKEIHNVKEVYKKIIYGYNRNKYIVDSFVEADSIASPFVFENWL